MKFKKDGTYQYTSIWLGAVIVGCLAVLFAYLIGLAQKIYYFYFDQNVNYISILSPFFFLLSAFLVKKLAPDAKGSGIPQVLEAIANGKKCANPQDAWNSPLISLRTASVKIISAFIAILGGASIGREGPMVQISSSVFAAIGKKVHRYFPKIDLSACLTVGAAAGVAAAFNTPLAGITFAIEEVVDGAFSTFRQPLMLAIIISGMTAQAFLGDYHYFGHPEISAPKLREFFQPVIIGLVGGLLGGIFARVLAYPKSIRLPKNWALRAFLCGVVCSGICYLTDGATAGSGYESTNKMLVASDADFINLTFPIYKIITTIFSYLSGMAGGIFSPCLSIGAGIGISIAKICYFVNFKTCALMGMVAFFSGVVQAPLTAVIIVTEMTDNHVLIIPLMIAAFSGQVIGRLFMPVPLYHFLAKRNEEG